jgi:nuclear transport factor 2 (NTF2) superfamily protein
MEHKASASPATNMLASSYRCTRDPARVKMAYVPDSIWRNRSTFLQGRDEIEAFLKDKWAREKGYRLRKELFAFTDNKACFSPSQTRSHPLLPRLANQEFP